MLKLPYSSVISVVCLMLFSVFVMVISKNLLGKNKTVADGFFPDQLVGLGRGTK